MTEGTKILIAYLVGIAANLIYFFDYINRNRCFKKEPGQVYGPGWGVDSWEGPEAVTRCFTDFIFSGRFVVLLVGLLGFIIYLMRDQATSTKIFVLMFVYFGIQLGYLEWITIQDNSVLGSGPR